jgi:acetyltransferase
MTVDGREIMLKNDEVVRIRPIRAGDEPLLVTFHRGLSDRSVYQRYFHMINLGHRIAHERLARICAVDNARETVLVMERTDEGGRPAIIGVARLTLVGGTADAEFAVLLTDAYQGLGGGSALLRALGDAGRARQVERFVADILTDNVNMQRMCQHLGMAVTPTGEPGLLRALLVL